MIQLRNITALIAAALFIVSCGNINKDDKTPWGDEPEGDIYDLDQILSSGGMIAVTLSGPDTYYDYRGSGTGTQFKLCERFAHHIGIPVRIDVCRDTAELIKKVESGEADLIACTIKPDADKKKQLNFCGVDIKGRGKWAVNRKSKVLADSLNAWFRPALIQEIENEEKLIAQGGHAKLDAQPKVLDRSNGIISKYDALFKRHAQTAGVDWHLLAAQCYQESSFDPNAQSYMGACGLMQIMPGTARELELEQNDIFDPEKNVSAAARYLSQLRDEFKDIPSPDERLKFMLAAYNGGKLHIRDAMALAAQDGKNNKRWAEVSSYVQKLAHPRYYNNRAVRHGYMRGDETVGYVDSIMSIWQQYRNIGPRGKANK